MSLVVETPSKTVNIKFPPNNRHPVRAFLKPLLVLVLCPVPLLAQSNSAELRLKVTDPDGLGVKSPAPSWAAMPPTP